MLTRLLVQNYALIDDLELSFGQGLHLLTGETGAGKSLLVGAIGLILGSRADKNVLLDEQRKCLVEAEIAGSLPSDIEQLLVEEGIPTDMPLLLRREIAPNGRSRAFVNDTPVSLELLRSLTEPFIDLHGQDDDQQLMRPAQQLSLLDQYAGCSNDALAFGKLLAEYRHITTELDALVTQQTEAAEQADFLQFQLEELNQANLSADEEDELEAEFKRQQHAEQIATALNQWADRLQNDEQGLLNPLADMLAECQKLVALDDRLKGPLGSLTEAEVLLQDAARDLAHLAEATELDPQRLAYLQQRLDTYNRLKLKYRCQTADELLARQAAFQQQLDGLTSADERIASLRRAQSDVLGQLQTRGVELETRRRAATVQLGPAVTEVLRVVGLLKATFTVAVEQTNHPEGELEVAGQRLRLTPTGYNRVEFRIQTNPGSPTGALSSMASGGERARVMLALKHALAARVGLSTLIFDEIDTGISGEVALQVGRLLAELGQKHQLLVITHLPQVASRPGRHFFLYKEVIDNRTYTRLRELSGDDRVLAIAEMISGDKPTASAYASARELLGYV